MRTLNRVMLIGEVSDICRQNDYTLSLTVTTHFDVEYQEHHVEIRGKRADIFERKLKDGMWVYLEGQLGECIYANHLVMLD